MKALEEQIKLFFPENGGHDIGHTLRVRKLALHIAKAEGADLEIVEAAALLHDIARAREEKGEVECHATQAASEVEAILKKAKFPEQKIEQVRHCVAVHRASKGMKANTVEAKIIQDADRLDVIGALGTARAFYKAGEANYPMYLPESNPNTGYKGQYDAALNHIIRKGVNLLKPESFNTKTGKMLAEQRYNFTKTFVDRFLAEWALEK